MDKNAFIKAFQVPSAAVSVIDQIVTPCEQQVLLQLPAVFRAADVQRALSDGKGEAVTLAIAEEFTRQGYRRGIFSLEEESGGLYKSSCFYGRLDIFVVSEPEVYAAFPEETRRALDAWYFAAYCGGLDTNPDSRPTPDEILPLAEILARLENDSRPLYLAPCDCRSLRGECGRPVMTCLSYRGQPNTFAHRGHARLIGKEEGAEIVRMADKAGLVHIMNGSGICNCCRDCCYLLRARDTLHSGCWWPKCPRVVCPDSAMCLGCGACAARCQFDALAIDAGALVFIEDRCAGCGLCVSACPAGALQLRDRS